MKLERLSDRILFVRFKNEEEMVKTIIRIAEYYENMKKFDTDQPTFSQFIRWYKANKEPKTPYASYFYGINLTGNEIKYFVRAYPKSKQLVKEREFIDAVKMGLGLRSLKETHKYSIIMCPASKRSSVFKHELAHAIYYMNTVYRDKVDDMISKINKHDLDKMREYLLTQEYNKSILDQEINSRLVEKTSLKRLFVGVNLRVSGRIRQELRQLLEDNLIK